MMEDMDKFDELLLKLFVKNLLVDFQRMVSLQLHRV